MSESEKGAKDLKEESKALKSEDENEDSEVSKKKPAEKPGLKMGGPKPGGLSSLGKRPPGKPGGGLMGSLSKKSKS